MQTPVLSLFQPAPTTAGTYYRPIGDSYTSGLGTNSGFAWSATQGNCWMPIPVAGTVSNLLMSFQNSASGYTFTLMKKTGSTVTSTAITVTPSGTTASDTTHIATFAAGDLFCIQCVVTGTPSSLGQIGCSIIFTTAGNQSVVFGGKLQTGNYPLDGSAAVYAAFQGTAGSGSVDGPFELMPCAGTIENLYCYFTNTITTGSWAVTFYYGASASTLSASVSSGQTGSDLTHSVSVTSGNLLSVGLIPTSSPTAQTAILYSFVFIPSVPNQSIWTYDLTPIGTGTYFNSMNGSDEDTTESNVQIPLCGGVMVSHLYTTINESLVGQISSGSVIFTVRRNGANSLITTTHTSASANVLSDITHNFTTTAGDLIAIETVNTSNGSISGNIYPCVGGTFTMSPQSAAIAGYL